MRPQTMTAAVTVAVALCLAHGGGSTATPDAGEVLRRVLQEPIAPGSVSSFGNVSDECMAHGRQYLRELANGTGWAIRMNDASAKVPAGLLVGSGDVMGNYDQCLGVIAPSQGLSGQYCTASITCPDCTIVGDTGKSSPTSEDPAPPTSVRYLVGLCAPSSCSSRDVEQHLNGLLESWSLGRGAHAAAEVRPQECHSVLSTGRPYRAADYAFLIMMAVFAALVIVGTAYDMYLNRSERKEIKGGPEWRAVILAFSLKTNVPPLFNTNSPEGSLSCIHGIRFLSIAWVVVFHAHAAVYRTPRTNADQTARFKESWYMMVMVNGSLATDSFLFIGGVLLAYIFTRERQKGHEFNIFTYYLHRYIRVTPAYAALIFFYATMFYRMGSGPLWDEFIKDERRKCVDWWFNNLLYVNNFNSNENTCIVQSWYLATDMQFYWLSPLVLYPMWKWPKIGWTIIVTGVVASTTALMAITALYSGYDFSQWYEDNWNLTYTPVYTRAGPYLLGLALGYLLQVLPKDLKMSKATVVIGWMTSLVLLAVTLFGGYRIRQQEYNYNPVEVTFYDGLHRTLWTAALAWLVFACVKGYGGPVNGILASGIMLPLGKLSYCVYLCHFAVIYARLGLTSTPVHIGLGDVFLDGILALVVSLAVSVVMSLIFEIPFLLIDKNIIVKRVAAVTNRMRRPTLTTSFKGTFSLQNHGCSSITSITVGSSSTVCTVDTNPAS